MPPSSSPDAVRRFLVDVAKQNGIPYQHEVLRAGGTDTGAIQRVRDGVLAGCISHPDPVYPHAGGNHCAFGRGKRRAG